MRKPMQKPEDFTQFYFTKVALGEGCGCAERIIDNHEFDRLASTQTGRSIGPKRRRIFTAVLRKIGVMPRLKAKPTVD